MKYRWYIMEITNKKPCLVYKNGRVSCVDIDSVGDFYYYPNRASAMTAYRRMNEDKIRKYYPSASFTVTGVPCKEE